METYCWQMSEKYGYVICDILKNKKYDASYDKVNAKLRVAVNPNNLNLLDRKIRGMMCDLQK